MDDDLCFGQWVKRRRKALDLTQEDLARRVGYSVSAIRKVEAEKLRPSRRVAEHLAGALGIRPEERSAFVRFARDEPGVDDLDLSLQSVTLSHPVMHRHLNNFPIPLTSFIGRERELAVVKELLSRQRLLTLTGAGGVGKTRLAIQVATDLVDMFRDGVLWVELAALSDPALVPQAIANVLGLRESLNQPLIEILSSYLLAHRSLLVLDNCEHLIAACAQLTETLLHACPDLHILVTSREPLGITGEVIWPVPPLSTPDLRRSLSEEADIMAVVPECEATRLFVERAGAVKHDFALTVHNARAVAQICQRLDGIPLAIELAAARARVLSVEQIADRLDDRFNLLTMGSRTALPRHQTLRATIDWSYDLLSEQERTLLRRLSVFVGGFTLEAADSVCAGEGIDKHEILNLLAHLVDKSLVIVVQQSEETRYGLLETIRQYADEKLRVAGEAPGIRQRHAQIFLAFAEEAAPQLNTAQRNEWMHRLQVEHENLRAAAAWSIEQGAAEVGFRLIGALEDFWVARGSITQARARLAELLALPGCELRPGEWNQASILDSSPSDTSEAAIPRPLAVARARALNAGASWAVYQEDLGEALVLSEESVALWRALDHKPGLVWALSRLGEVKECLGDDAAAHALWEESFALAQSIGARPAMGWTLLWMGRFAFRKGDVAAARSLMHQSLAIWHALENATGILSTFRELGYLVLAEGDYAAARSLFEESLNMARGFENTLGISHALLPLGHLALWQGDDMAACSFYEETLALGRASNQKGIIAASLCGLGIVAFKQGKLAAARSRVRESLSILGMVRNKHEITQYMECLARVAYTEARPDRTARLLGASAALRETLCSPAPPDDLEDRDFAASVRAALGEEAFMSALEEGRAMLLEQAIEQAFKKRGDKRAPTPQKLSSPVA
jgi:predicted ATPase/DNA-binding XRE family transcriptional regulator